MPIGWGEAVKGFLISLPLLGRIVLWIITKGEKGRVAGENEKRKNAAYHLDPDDVGPRLRKRLRR